MKNILLSIFLSCVITTSANYLDPSVFKNISSFSLPEVRNDVTIDFEFVSYENTLLDAVSHNATYDVTIDSAAALHPVVLSLVIPLEEVHLVGKYRAGIAFSSTSIARVRGGLNPLPFREGPFSSSGAYSMTMTNVQLSFMVDVKKETRGVSLQLFYCNPVVGELSVEITPAALEEDNIDVEFLHHMIRVAAKRDFSEMFCDAMGRLLQSRDHFIIKAIHARIKEFEASATRH